MDLSSVSSMEELLQATQSSMNESLSFQARSSEQNQKFQMASAAIARQDAVVDSIKSAADRVTRSVGQ